MIASSELILNKDSSIYHLNLHPGDLADTIITVGDQGRVDQVSKYFDTIEFETQKREFKTATGRIGQKRFSVISTGIGCDNIDIVMNEIDALFNIDFRSRKLKEARTQLTFIRVGTSGGIRPELEVDSLLTSEYAIGFDSLVYFYRDPIIHKDLQSDFMNFCNGRLHLPVKPYAEASDFDLPRIDGCFSGITFSCPGFYGPQFRSSVLTSFDSGFLSKITDFEHNGLNITNIEMETSALYGMAHMLGHRAISYNAILANRANGTFSAKPKETIDRLIREVLNAFA